MREMAQTCLSRERERKMLCLSAAFPVSENPALSLNYLPNGDCDDDTKALNLALRKIVSGGLDSVNSWTQRSQWSLPSSVIS